MRPGSLGWSWRCCPLPAAAACRWPGSAKRPSKGGKGDRPVSHNAKLCKERNTVERLINKLKAWPMRDRLAEVFADEPFADAFGVRSVPGLSPGVLSLVTVLQFAEDLTDRQAAAMAVRAIDWKYALGAELTDTGFDASVLSPFRTRLAGHGMERLVFDRLLERCKDEGLVAAGGKQRTDSTHVMSAVRDLNRLELAGERVRAGPGCPRDHRSGVAAGSNTSTGSSPVRPTSTTRRSSRAPRRWSRTARRNRATTSWRT